MAPSQGRLRGPVAARAAAPAARRGSGYADGSTSGTPALRRRSRPPPAPCPSPTRSRPTSGSQRSEPTAQVDIWVLFVYRNDPYVDLRDRKSTRLNSSHLVI